MNNSYWLTEKNLIKELTPIKIKEKIEHSGIPLIFKNDTLYIDNKENHTLLIAGTGSGKTQVSTLPTIHLAMKASESFVVTDVNGELYQNTAFSLKEENYNVIVLDFADAKMGNSWNPLDLAYQLYKNKEVDKAYELIENLGYYLFFEKEDKTIDPFWFNSTKDYFTGLVLYLFENAKEEEINLLSVYELSNYLNENDTSKKFLEKLNTNSSIYSNLITTLKAPFETRGSIISVFSQRIKKYISRDILKNMLSSSDFDIKNIGNEKTAVFLISGQNNYGENLISLFINQIVNCVDIYGKKEKTCHIISDNFDTLIPIYNFNKMIEFCRSIKIKFTVAIRSYQHLNNMYSKEESNLLKLCFGNIIYLLSNDISTLEEISDYCGNTLNNKPLITVEELKLLEPFEAIILMPRRMPFRTKLLPDYKINWGYTNKKVEVPKRKENEIKV